MEFKKNVIGAIHLCRKDQVKKSEKVKCATKAYAAFEVSGINAEFNVSDLLVIDDNPSKYPNYFQVFSIRSMVVGEGGFLRADIKVLKLDSAEFNLNYNGILSTVGFPAYDVQSALQPYIISFKTR